MIILITGPSHTGKTLLAQRLLEKYHYPYLSIDHLKMGLIRSGNTELTPMDDDKLTDYLWPIVREMIKTAIENSQNLIVEGCYVPFDWKKDFEPIYRKYIHYRCLVMSQAYIEANFESIRTHACAIEQRLDAEINMEALIRENKQTLQRCEEFGCPYVLIDDTYPDNLYSPFAVTSASFEDMSMAAHIMVTSFQTAFAEFVTPQTMHTCTNPENCRNMLEKIYADGDMQFLLGDNQGFICWQVREAETEIVALHTLPESWGTGLGHALLTEALNQIGDRSVFLWAFKVNTRARRFYEKHGFVWDGNERVSEFDGLVEVKYIRTL